jgi:hypothetical protein
MLVSFKKKWILFQLNILVQISIVGEGAHDLKEKAADKLDDARKIFHFTNIISTERLCSGDSAHDLSERAKAKGQDMVHSAGN